MRQLCRVLQASTDAVSSGLLGWLVRETRNIGKKKECSTKPGDVSNACHVSLAVRDLFETEGETCSMDEMSVAVPGAPPICIRYPMETINKYQVPKVQTRLYRSTSGVHDGRPGVAAASVRLERFPRHAMPILPKRGRRVQASCKASRRGGEVVPYREYRDSNCAAIKRWGL